jgi:hypothetical protein
LQERYAILGNGVATRIAFLSIGRRNAMPFIEPQLRLQVAWLLPLVVAVIAAVCLERKYGRGARHEPDARTAPDTGSSVSVAALSPDSAG